jgi:hypothetical protein
MKRKNNDAFVNEGFYPPVVTGTLHYNGEYVPKYSSDTETAVKLWDEPFKGEVNEYSDRIEIIYIQRSNTQLAVYPPISPKERVFKIVFSCVDGVWNKSEPIYGTIISAKGESYEF